MRLLFAFIVLGVVAIVLLVVAARRNGHAPRDADPLFTAGIAIAGASAALIATIGLATIPMLLVGLVVMIIGARRTHSHSS